MGHGLNVYPYQQCSRNCHFDGNYTAKCGALLSLVWTGDHCFCSLFLHYYD